MRSDIVNAIESERDYQYARWGEKGQQHEIDAWLLYIHGYTTKAINESVATDNKEETLHMIRKIATLCVACMEQHGAPLRY